MSDDDLALKVGNFIKHHRLQHHKTQEWVAEAAVGISRSTLSLLERGETVTLATLIQVLRVLDQLQVMEIFEIQQSISPLALAKAEKSQQYN